MTMTLITFIHAMMHFGVTSGVNIEHFQKMKNDTFLKVGSASGNSIAAEIFIRHDTTKIILSIFNQNEKGWFLIGFNQKDELQNARLFFVRIADNKAHVEEHRADHAYPAPFHKIATINSAKITVHDFHTTKNRRQVTFTAPILGEHSDQVDLGKCQTAFAIFAYSNEDDFNHHSVSRVSTPIELAATLTCDEKAGKQNAK